MIRRAALALLLAAAPGLAQAGDPIAFIAPTAPLLDNGDRIANTAFVNNFFSNLPLAQGKIYVGNISNIATAVTPSGDCTISVPGVVTCTQAAGNFNVVGTLTAGGLATFNAGATVNGTLTVNGWIVDRFGGVTVNGVKQPQFAWALPLSPGGIVFQDKFGLNVLQSPFPNKFLQSGFKGQPPKWTQTAWSDSYAGGSLLYSKGPNSIIGLPIGTNGQVLSTDGLNPVWSSAGTGTVTSVVIAAGTGLAVSGTCTITTTGTCTPALATIATGTYLANTSGGTTTPSANALPVWVQKIASFTTDARSTTATVYRYRCVGGGGGSGGAAAASNAATGGGGSGAYEEGTFSGVAASVSITISAGAAGTAGSAAGGNAGNGGNTTISGTGMSTVTAALGTGSVGNTVSNTGTAGGGGGTKAGTGSSQDGQQGAPAQGNATNQTGGIGGANPLGFGGAPGQSGVNGVGVGATGLGSGGPGVVGTAQAGNVGRAGGCIVDYVL